MIKFVAVYRVPPDVEAFERHFNDVHMPLVRAIPGLGGVEVLKVRKALVGEPALQQIVTLAFDDMAAFKAAAGTPEWAAIGQDAGTHWGEQMMSAYLAETAAEPALAR